MNDADPEKSPPSISMEVLSTALGHPARWRMVRELAMGEALPVQELAKRAGCSPSVGSKHMGVLRRAGLVVQGYGRLYLLAPQFRPAPGAKFADLGHCHMRLDTPM